MVITDITELDKKRSKVYIDGEYAFVLYKGELRDYNIKTGSVIERDVFDDIVYNLLPKRAVKRAMNLLQKKDYTEKQLRDKLSDGLYSDEQIDKAIEYVKSFHYLDDERYARDYITYHMEMRSKNRVIQDLTGKGIDKDIVNRIADELYCESDDDVEQQQIKKLLEKKHYRPDMDYKEKQKIIAFLMRRGYSFEAIKGSMQTLY